MTLGGCSAEDGFMLLSIQVLLVVATTLYQAIAVWRENQQLPPGQFVDLGGYRLHLYVIGQSSSQPTIVLDHSLGGMEGYLLVDQLAQFGQVCIYDRAGYGWSDPSPYPRTSQQVVTELDALLTQARIQPPYLLIGNSFGSYNMRLYAHRFPEKPCGLVLTDGLHETGMLTMPIQLRALPALPLKLDPSFCQHFGHGRFLYNLLIDCENKCIDNC